VSGTTRPSWAGALGDGDWTTWPGLPVELREHDLGAALGRDLAGAGLRPALLGRRHLGVAELPGLRWWLDGTRVVLVEIENPPCAGTALALLDRLGPSDRTGDGRHRRFDATTFEHVYAGRGLSVTVAESYDDPPGFEPFLAAVLLFAPTDLRGFVLELGGNDRGGPRL
jgi:hypothetical protein